MTPAPPVRNNGGMDRVSFGATGLTVSRLGLGAGALGDPGRPEADAARLLDAALDLGVTLLDAARSYGLAEERLGRLLGPRRGRVVLSTKVGYGVPPHEDWSGPCVAAGVERALAVLRVERLDIVHLHSCPPEVLARGEVVDALVRARDAGRIGVAAYSGDNEALAAAAADARFGAIQCSVSLLDTAALRGAVPAAAARGMGVLAKRPLANAPWLGAAAPDAPDRRTYHERWQALRTAAPWLETTGLPLQALFLRFAAHAPGVSACLVGTGRPEHLEAAVRALEAGPLPADLRAEVEAAAALTGRDWPGVI